MKKIVLSILFILFTPTLVSASEYVYLGGDSIGIVGEFDGLLVSGVQNIEYNDEIIPISNTIQPNDIIVSVDNEKITDISHFNAILQRYNQVLNEVPIQLLRKGKYVHTTLYFTYINKKYNTGLFFKENTTGIGTVTFYEKDTNTFGALGHAILNENNETITSGSIYQSTIQNIKKASKNTTGGKLGSIHYDQKIGTIDKNCNIGIYGTYEYKDSFNTYIETAEKEELQIGPAYFYTVIKDDNIQKYTIEITKIHAQLDDEKAIEFTITDPKILNSCGGVIQGMSGSPIVQNGKLIGAITHVSLENPTKGYALYIENMLKETP